MANSETITVRVSPSLRLLLQQRSELTQLSLSGVIRQSVEYALVGVIPDSAIDESMGLAPEDELYDELGLLAIRAQHEGILGWIDRKELFRMLLGQSVAAEQSRLNRIERDLCLELLRIGRRFGLV